VTTAGGTARPAGTRTARKENDMRPNRPVPSPARRLLTVAALAAGTALLAAGCTAAPGTAPTGTHTSTPVAVAGLPTGVRQATAVPTDVPNTPGLRHDVTVASCGKTDGGWKASGTAANRGDSAHKYRIAVFFTTDTGTVIGTGDTTVTVKPGKKGDWTVTSKLTPAPKTVCVLRGVG